MWVVTNETQKMLAEHTKLLLGQYKTIRGVYGWPNKMLMELIEEYWPDGAAKFFDAFDMWLEQALNFIEKGIDDYVAEYAKAVSDIKFSAPNTDHYKMLVNEHTKLWLENYGRLIERREQVSYASLAALKQMLPAQIHPILDNANDWLMRQSEAMDMEIINRVKQFCQAQESSDQ